MTVTADGQALSLARADSKYKDPNYVRVSTVLKVANKGERIVKWYYKFKTHAEMLEGLRKAAERGSHVDQLVKNLMLREPVEVPPEYEKYIQAFNAWKQEWDFNLLRADFEVYDPKLQYVGTLDLFGELTQKSDRGLKSKKIIIDVKTGVPARGQDGQPVYEVYNNQHWQTAAYRSAMEVMLDENIEGGSRCDGNWILRLFSDGKYVFQPDNDYAKSLKIFKSLLTIYKLDPSVGK